ncbi:unnamed protein product [marine sediment metagenome]|uniref:Uncharacterized protein n=1 Tax=marine sediment metagenome TaxID=412755 RepID=X1CWN5_9ZZZZ
MFVFPPVSHPLVTLDANNTPIGQSVVAGCIWSYGFIVEDYKNIRYEYLSAQLIIVIFVAVGLIYVSRDRKDKHVNGQGDN